MKRHGVVLLCALMLTSLSRVAASSVSVDDVSSVTVHDGDTFDTSKGWTVRLADIDAPESYESGYSAAKAYLTSLVEGQAVYLDVDPLLDPYDRYVCLAYVRHNATHLLNVNLDLVLAGHAVVQNYTNNQFNPADWIRYVSYDPTYPIHVDSTLFNVTIISNSTISDVAFNQTQKQLRFTVTGTSTGYCNVTIPKHLLGGTFTVLVNDAVTTSTVLADEQFTYLYFRYAHSTHGVTIVGTTVVPEFTTFTVFVLVITTMILRRVVVFHDQHRRRSA